LLLIFLLVLLSLTIISLVLILIYSSITAVVPMPSSMGERLMVLEILRDYPEIDRFTDLGSGWGGMGRLLAKAFPDRRIQCVELSIIPYLASRLISQTMSSKSIQYHRMNFQNYPLEGKAAYICYLSGPVMKKLSSHFDEKLRSGNIVISIAFAIPGWTPVRVEYVQSAIPAPVYVYEI
jgi:hypothetical protein